jgi:peptidoglycan/LPS O-acetylase OafA/YrhL
MAVQSQVNDTAVSVQCDLGSKHIPILDGLRAVSALLVVLYHCGVAVPAGLGVLAFFVISGFLITWLLLNEHASNGRISLKRFYQRRSLRIFPAFYCYWLLLVTASFLHNRSIPLGQALASFFYVNNYYQVFAGDPNTALSHTWSLAIEEQFYVLWPLCFLLLAGNLKRMIKALSIAIVCVWVYRAVLLAARVDQGYFYEAFDPRADHLMAGCLLAALLKSEWAPKIVRVVSYARIAPYISIALLAASGLATAKYGAAYRDSIGFTVEPLLVAVLIPQLIAFRKRASWRWLDSRVMMYLGAISYSTYLYQQLVVGIVFHSLVSLHYALQLSLSVAASIAAASASYHFIEQPFRRLRRAPAKVQPQAAVP